MTAGEVLSQSEIDALLAALSTGEMSAEELKKEEEGRRVKAYDFRRALRFSKDQIRSLTRIHENFARLLTTFFSAQLRTYVQISVASADQIPYEEFVRSIPKMTVINVFEVPPLNGHVLLEVNPNIAYAMLDRVMGGRGVGMDKVDQLTEIETRIMSNLFDKAFVHWRDAWESVAEVDPLFVDFEVNPQFLRMIAPNDTVVVISLNTQVGEARGMMNVCIPHVVLEPIMPRLSVHYWMQAQKRDRSPEEAKQLEQRVRAAKLPIIAELGTASITINEFLQLEVGDVIQLEQSIHEPLVVKIGHIPKFIGQPGKRNKKLAVQILAMSEGDGDSHDE
ncbi:flagellar motor switch protein FliM [Geobacillus sp. C56-T2]|uniref:flagellar motor switch protein FliM n=1 Tax=unclassified Geobacillus TaxID=2642459 RepID=UPI0011AA7CFF|nr:flagellar motor switch protein FliM [Geobacillus sp. C56-T2]NNV05013.1 flagellar motor switch protein FliM [Geobacillus sp. MMMUD3]TWG30084.1 flagellar motor switch protein FliM [Geobacillus sp. C56-T2]